MKHLFLYIGCTVLKVHCLTMTTFAFLCPILFAHFGLHKKYYTLSMFLAITCIFWWQPIHVVSSFTADTTPPVWSDILFTSFLYMMIPFYWVHQSCWLFSGIELIHYHGLRCVPLSKCHLCLTMLPGTAVLVSSKSTRERHFLNPRTQQSNPCLCVI